MEGLDRFEQLGVQDVDTVSVGSYCTGFYGAEEV